MKHKTYKLLKRIHDNMNVSEKDISPELFVYCKELINLKYIKFDNNIFVTTIEGDAALSEHLRKLRKERLNFFIALFTLIASLTSLVIPFFK